MRQDISVNKSRISRLGVTEGAHVSVSSVTGQKYLSFLETTYTVFDELISHKVSKVYLNHHARTFIWCPKIRHRVPAESNIGINYDGCITFLDKNRNMVHSFW